MAGPVTVQCPICRAAFPVPTDVIGARGHEVIVRMDRSGLYGHMRECEGKAAEAPKAAPLPAFIAAGARTCTMCGIANTECMGRLNRSGKGCCPACEDGDTHPAPGVDRGATDRRGNQ
jgi:hypothetical protein